MLETMDETASAKPRRTRGKTRQNLVLHCQCQYQKLNPKLTQKAT